jgi:hypothetical protein
MCRMLRVSRQGFYQWRDRPPSQRQLDDAALTERICKIHVGHGGRVGVRRVLDELRRAAVHLSRGVLAENSQHATPAQLNTTAPATSATSRHAVPSPPYTLPAPGVRR